MSCAVLPTHRTRIKICGLTRAGDVDAAVSAGADAIGLVFYPPSPRAVDLAQAQALCRELPPFVTVTALFVEPDAAQVQTVLDHLPVGLLQFHGDETADFCARFGRPWMKAARVRPRLDLADFAHRYRHASALLLDAFVDGYGGGGKRFDWSLIPPGLAANIVLAGGLDADNVGAAVRRLRPWAVDVSSGVEVRAGIKDAGRIKAFVEAVRAADELEMEREK